MPPYLNLGDGFIFLRSVVFFFFIFLVVFLFIADSVWPGERL